jgi:heptosyltransferase-2
VNASPLERIYVRLPNWVGDVVLATPFLGALRKAFPSSEIVAHGRERFFELIDGTGVYDRAVPLVRRGGPTWPFLEGARLRKLVGRVDAALLCPNSLSAAIIARVMGARRRIGYRLNARGPLLTDALVAKKEGRLRPTPMVDYYLGLLGPLGVDTTGVLRRPFLAVTEKARARAAEILRRAGVREGERVWALNAGGAWETKRWIPEYLGELADRVAARGARPFLLHGPGEDDILRRALAVAKSPILGTDEMVPLADLAALLERCELLVTTDSGPRHIGVAAGIPVLALIGPTHPAYTIVDHPAVSVLCEQVDCWPCHLSVCPVDFRCMKRLTPDKVLSAAESLLERAPRRANLREAKPGAPQAPRGDKTPSAGGGM